jgi:cysteine desulfurase family protein
VIYLDNAATTFPKPEEVHVAMDRFGREEAANPGRGLYRTAIKAEERMREARVALARLLGAPDPDRLIFALNATDALNLALKGTLRDGDHAVTSDLEHNSVLRPLHGLARAGRISLTVVRSQDGGLLDPADVAKAMTAKTRLVALTHASNVLGSLQPIDALGAEVRRRGALFLVDASQTAGVVPIRLSDLPVDLLAFTGHKGLLGPMGTGGLYLGERASDVRPWREGGTGFRADSPHHPDELPYRLEGGTPNVIGIAGLLAGVQVLEARGVDAVLAHERRLLAQLLDGLQRLPRVRLYGPRDAALRTGICSFTVDGLDPKEVVTALDQEFAIAARAGLHCAPLLHERLGTLPGGTCRFSVGPFTTPGDVAAGIDALRGLAGRSGAA